MVHKRAYPKEGALGLTKFQDTNPFLNAPQAFHSKRFNLERTTDQITDNGPHADDRGRRPRVLSTIG